jgi:peptidyl-prolyl cis-trans isomerase SurA
MRLLALSLAAIALALLPQVVSAQATAAGTPPAGAKKPPAATAKPATTPQPAPAAKTAAAKDDASTRASRSKSGNKAIAVLVNDEPITSYEIEQRAALLSLSGGNEQNMKAKAEARWAQIIKDPKTNERFKQLLAQKGVKTQEEAKALQTQFVKDLQRDMIEGLRRESRSASLAANRSKAQDELIDEKLKLQAAKNLSVMASNSDVDNFINGIAERNKMNATQFAQHLKGMGIDIATMRQRFLAEISWRDVIRKRFGHLISITGRDVDKLVAASPEGEEEVELQLQRIVIPMPAKVDQKIVAQRLTDAQAAAAKFTDCKSTGALAAEIGGAKFEDLGNKKPASISEPTRSLLLNAKEGDMLPPSVGEKGIELWAVCGRKVLTANEQKRESAEASLRQQEFEIMARKHLKDLRQDAAIEYR